MTVEPPLVRPPVWAVVVAAEVLVGSLETGVVVVEVGSVDTGVPVIGTVDVGSVAVGSVDTGVPVVGSVVVVSLEVVVVVVGSVEVVVVPVVVVPSPAPVVPGVEVEEVPAGYPACGASNIACLPRCCSDRFGWPPTRAVVLVASEGTTARGAEARARTRVTEATVIGPAVVVAGCEDAGTTALAAAFGRARWWCGVAETCWIPIAPPAATTVAAMIAAT